MIRAAAEARPLLIAQTKGDQRRLLELKRVRLLASVSQARELAIHANHLERSFSKIVRLFGVERQYLIGNCLFRNQDCHDALGPESPHSREPVVTVRSPVAHTFVVGFIRAYDDDRVEKARDLTDDVFQLAQVRFREVALERRRPDPLDRQSNHHEPVARIGLPVGSQRLSAIALHHPLQLGYLRRWRPRLELGRGQSGRGARRLSTPPPFSCFLLRHASSRFSGRPSDGTGPERPTFN